MKDSVREIKEFAKSYSVSERTARRYIKAGKIPTGKRMKGCDGKYYHINYKRAFRSDLHTPLTSALANVRKAVSSIEVYATDIALLRNIVIESSELLRIWESGL